MENDYCVYMHRNVINGKVYIGITGNLNRRWHNNGIEYIQRGHLFGNAIEKYGWDNFEHVILHDHLSKDEACALEKEYIAKYKSNATRYYNPSYGYNLTDGGENICGCIRIGDKNSFYGRTHLEETKQYLSSVNTGKFVGEKSPLFGVSKSDDMKKMISESLKTWYAEHDSPHNIPVLCVTDGKIFKSGVEASKYYGIQKSEISACCLGKRKTTHGLVFTYSLDGTLPEYKERIPLSDEQRNAIRERKSIPVICLETGIIYPSGKDAAAALGHPAGKSTISTACKNGNRAYGYHWKRVNNTSGGDEDWYSDECSI